jgi:acyl-CoA thioesterase FadM
VGLKGDEELEGDGYRVIAPVPVVESDYDRQGHLNNAAIVRMFNDMRISYVFDHVGTWWGEEIRAREYVVAARELHVLYESEGRPGEDYSGAMKYVGREGKAAILEQRIVEATTARSVARAWVVQLLVQRGTVVQWPPRFFEVVEQIEGRAIPTRTRGPARAWGPPS